MNTFLCLSVLLAVASATHHHIPKPQAYVSSWGQPIAEGYKFGGAWKQDAGLSYAAVPTQSYSSGYWGPSYVSSPVYARSAEVSPKFYSGSQYLFGSRASPNYKFAPVAASWASDDSYVPSTWSGYYSAGAPVTANFEKQVVAAAPRPVAAPVAPKVDQVAPVADVASKVYQYSTEIVHDVPTKKEEIVSPVGPSSRSFSVVPQVAPVNKIVSAPAQYAAWSGEAKPVVGSWVSDVKPAPFVSEVKPASFVSEVKPASWASEVKPATWTSEVKPASFVSEVKPASWASEVKPVGWTSEIKPASWSWAEPKPVQYGAWSGDVKPIAGSWASDVKPASWGSWSEPKPSWGSYVQPAFYGASYSQPIISTNAHHNAIAAPWASPVEWTEPIQKRSERRQF